MGENCEKWGFTTVDKWTADGDRRGVFSCHTTELNKLVLEIRLRKKLKKKKRYGEREIRR